MPTSHLYKPLLRSLFFMVLASPAGAQCLIKGSITDSAKTAVPFAATGLLSAKDSSLINGVLTNDSGSFTFKGVKPGTYLIKVQVTGYADYYSLPVTVIDSKTITLPVIRLKSKGTNLKDVHVVADKPFMQRDADKTIFNVENSIIATGKNALELLNELPGVTADDNANINVHGKGGVLVLVDEKPIYTDLATYLKSIDASMIDKIEVITNPSARYAAEGKAVINIVLKKNKNLGFNGQFTSNYRQWMYAGFNENLNLDYRLKKWNFFINTGLNIFHNYTTHTLNETLSNPNGTQVVFDENSPQVFQGIQGFCNGGIDFMPDSRQTITLAVDGSTFLTPDKSTINNITKIHSSNSVVDSVIYNPSVSNFTNTDFIYSLSYLFKIDTNGQELSASLGYLPFRDNNTIQSPIDYDNNTGGMLRPSTLWTANQPCTINVWHSQVDYTHPFNKKIKLDMGLEEQNASTDNVANFWNIINGASLIDTTRTNRFDFKENVFAGYMNYSMKLNEKFDFQAGLRAEQTNDHGLQYVHDTSFTRNYLNLFPSGSINWKVNNSNSFSLSFTRRIDRPGYDDLNPFVNILTPYTYIQGNVNLLPQLSNNYELDYNLNELINLTLGYITFTNVVTFSAYRLDTTLITIQSLNNVGNYNVYYGVLTSTLHPTHWWTTINTLYSYHDNYFGDLYGNNFNNAHLSFQFQSNNMFNFKHGWRADLMYWYHSKNLNGEIYNDPMSNLDIGISKRFFNDRLTVNLSCTDVFAGQLLNNTQYTPGLNMVDTRYEDTRKFRVGLTWKFGKSEYHRENTPQQNLLLKGAKQ